MRLLKRMHLILDGRKVIRQFGLHSRIVLSVSCFESGSPNLATGHHEFSPTDCFGCYRRSTSCCIKGRQEE